MSIWKLLVTSKVSKPDDVTQDAFENWYDHVHVPDTLLLPEFRRAIRFKSVDPTSARPNLLLYDITTKDILSSDAFKTVPIHSELFPPPHHCFAFVDFRLECLESIMTFDHRASNEAESVKSIVVTTLKITDDLQSAPEDRLGTVLGQVGSSTDGHLRTQLCYTSAVDVMSVEAVAAKPSAFMLLMEFSVETSVELKQDIFERLEGLAQTKDDIKIEHVDSYNLKKDIISPSWTSNR